ncbi:MAG: hypothetical protein V9H69_05815 [Anaerolineae bacterium]
MAPSTAFQLAPMRRLKTVVSSKSLDQARRVKIPRKSKVGHPTD